MRMKTDCTCVRQDNNFFSFLNFKLVFLSNMYKFGPNLHVTSLNSSLKRDIEFEKNSVTKN